MFLKLSFVFFSLRSFMVCHALGLMSMWTPTTLKLTAFENCGSENGFITWNSVLNHLDSDGRVALDLDVDFKESLDLTCCYYTVIIDKFVDGDWQLDIYDDKGINPYKFLSKYAAPGWKKLIDETHPKITNYSYFQKGQYEVVSLEVDRNATTIPFMLTGIFRVRLNILNCNKEDIICVMAMVYTKN